MSDQQNTPHTTLVLLVNLHGSVLVLDPLPAMSIWKKRIHTLKHIPSENSPSFTQICSVQFFVTSLQNYMQTFDSVTRANLVAFYCVNLTLCIQNGML